MYLLRQWSYQTQYTPVNWFKVEGKWHGAYNAEISDFQSLEAWGTSWFNCWSTLFSLWRCWGRIPAEMEWEIWIFCWISFCQCFTAGALAWGQGVPHGPDHGNPYLHFWASALSLVFILWCAAKFFPLRLSRCILSVVLLSLLVCLMQPRGADNLTLWLCRVRCL